MKNACVRTLISGSLIALATHTSAQVVVTGGGLAPTIVSQPASQTAAYGSDVTLSVAATGQGLKYVWQKNGVNLADYNNVAGSHSANLHLVGAALDDVGNYQAIIFSSTGGAITSSVATLKLSSTVVFSDDFENGLGNWRAVRGAAPLVLDPTINHTDGGTNAATAELGERRIYHSLPRKLSGRVRLTFWMYDDGTSKMAYGELRGYSGEVGYAKYVNRYGRGLQQSFAVGYRSVKSTNDDLIAETLDPTKYQAHVLRGKNAGWVNLNLPGAPNRSPGWHKFEIHRHRNEQRVEFYVDGVLGRVVDGAKAAAIDTVMLGGWGSMNKTRVNTGMCSFDDIALEAYPSTFDYENSISSGPIPTLMQLRETGTNEAMAAISPAVVAESVGSIMQPITGDWVVADNGIAAQTVRGRLACALNAPADDMYRIEVEGREHTGRPNITDMPLNVWLDGEFLGRCNLEYSGTSNGIVHVFTPFIRAGSHTVQVEWDNARPRRSLFVQAVRLQSLQSSDVTASGMKTWVAHRLSAQNGLEVINSRTSPACIEGRGQHIKTMSLQAGTAYPLSAFPVRHGAGHRWYANVPLSSAAATRVEISYQNGGMTETNDIDWEVTNLGTSDDLTIRKGDALLLTVAPSGVTNGLGTITIGTDTLKFNVANPVAYRFKTGGVFVVTGTYGTASRSITVKVVDASLDPVVAVLGWRSHWDCTNLPPEAVLQWDPRLDLGDIRPTPAKRLSKAPPPTLPQGPNVRSFRVSNVSVQEPRYVVARAGTNGPIIASAAVQGVRFAIPPETSLRNTGQLADGSHTIEGTYLLWPVLTNLTVSVHIATGGVTFDDGTIDKLLTPADFDPLGLCRLKYIRGPKLEGSVCHMCQVYDNGVLIERK